MTEISMDDRTSEILRRFDNSWITTENFYEDLINNYSGFERLKFVIQFIRTLKQSGQDKFFRLGTSVHILVISRSVDHGLRSDQKHIKIDVFDNKFEITLCDGVKIYRQYMVDDLNDIRVTKLLATLRSTLVD